MYPIYNHNWRNISTIYIYKTRLGSNEIFSLSNKIHREVGQAKDLINTLVQCHLSTYRCYRRYQWISTFYVAIQHRPVLRLHEVVKTEVPWLLFVSGVYAHGWRNCPWCPMRLVQQLPDISVLPAKLHNTVILVTLTIRTNILLFYSIILRH